MMEYAKIFGVFTAFVTLIDSVPLTEVGLDAAVGKEDNTTMLKTTLANEMHSNVQQPLDQTTIKLDMPSQNVKKDNRVTKKTIHKLSKNQKKGYNHRLDNRYNKENDIERKGAVENLVRKPKKDLEDFKKRQSEVDPRPKSKSRRNLDYIYDQDHETIMDETDIDGDDTERSKRFQIRERADDSGDDQEVEAPPVIKKMKPKRVLEPVSASTNAGSNRDEMNDSGSPKTEKLIDEVRHVLSKLFSNIVSDLHKSDSKINKAEAERDVTKLPSFVRFNSPPQRTFKLEEISSAVHRALERTMKDPVTRRMVNDIAHNLAIAIQNVADSTQKPAN